MALVTALARSANFAIWLQSAAAAAAAAAQRFGEQTHSTAASAVGTARSDGRTGQKESLVQLGRMLSTHRPGLLDGGRAGGRRMATVWPVS